MHKVHEQHEKDVQRHASLHSTRTAVPCGVHLAHFASPFCAQFDFLFPPIFLVTFLALGGRVPSIFGYKYTIVWFNQIEANKKVALCCFLFYFPTPALCSVECGLFCPKGRRKGRPTKCKILGISCSRPSLGLQYPLPRETIGASSNVDAIMICLGCSFLQFLLLRQPFFSVVACIVPAQDILYRHHYASLTFYQTYPVTFHAHNYLRQFYSIE